MIHSSNSYIPLARKYRPATFSELAGQDATATALANAIRLGREPHAVIFSGVRGIGKTTSARLYAKALNCDTALSPEPCNHCESCLAITAGNHEDVMEIDGASNTSVDDVRALRETVSYVPQRSRFKVYIIDEVHMLSQSAFNALLKTLEEPPAHVVFIFATTELQKIPQTIMSRCQLFHLQRMGLNTIRERIIHILKTENLTYEDKAVVAIAREGHGSMRDALTLLDHVIAVGAGNVTVAALSKIVAHVSSTQFLELLDALVCRDPGRIIAIMDELEDSGISMQDVAEKVAGMARHAFVVRDVGTESIDFKALGFDDEETRRLAEIALRAAPADLNRIFRTITRARTELDGSMVDRYVVENYCLEWCLDPGLLFQASPVRHQTQGQSPSAPVTSPTKTVANLRESLHAQSAKPAATPVQTAAAPTHPTPEQLPSKATPSLPATWRELVDVWRTKHPLQAKRLEDVHPVVYTNDRIELVVPTDSFLSAALLKPEEQRKLKDAFKDLFGYSGGIFFAAKKSGAAATSTPEVALPDTVSTEKQRENSVRREQVIVDAQNNPVTKDAMSLFNATIESIEMNT